MKKNLTSALLALLTIVCLLTKVTAQTTQQYSLEGKVNLEGKASVLSKVAESIEISSIVIKLSGKELTKKYSAVNFNKINNIESPIVNPSFSSIATQTFSNTTSATLNGTNCGPLNQCNNTNCGASSGTIDEFPIAVSGISCPTGLVSNGVITQVCIDISGTAGQSFMDATTIYLASPNGVTMELFKGNCQGGAGLGMGCALTNYVGQLCFQTGATAQPVTAAGTYAPQQPFSTLNNSNLNGTWELIVVGQECPNGLPPATFNSWSITFESADIYPPQAKCKDLTVYLNALGQGGFSSSEINNGSADDCAGGILSVNRNFFTCADIGANTVTLSVQDAAGNLTTCNSTITVVDTVSPTAICQDITVYLDASGNSTITTGNIDNGSADACGIKSLTLSKTSFNCTNIGTNVVTLTVTDNNDNIKTCNATVTVLDTISPTATCQNFTVYLDASGNRNITTTDIDNGSTDACGIKSLALSKSSFNCSNVGANTVTLTVTDNNDNVKTCNATVTVLDTISSTASCQNFMVYLDASGNSTITTGNINYGSFDACGIKSLVLSKTSFDCTNIGANSVTLTLTDNNDNVKTCNATVTVLDTIPPMASCQDITVYLDASGNSTITTGNIDNGSADACGIKNLALSKSSFDCTNTGSNTVTLTVTDNNDNVKTCNASVTVLDTISPTAICQNLTIYLDASGNRSIMTAAIDNGSTDACGIKSLALSKTSFDCSNLGSNTVTLTVTDNNDNAKTCNASVTVLDTISPTAICQNISLYLDASGNGSITTGDIDNGSADACGIKSLAVSKTSFDCANTGSNTVTLTVTDNNDNVKTCSATVTVLDTVAPTAICKNINLPLDAMGNATLTSADINNGAADACGISGFSANPSSFTSANLGANTVTLTVTDNNGNTANCTATVTIQDLSAPNVICQNISLNLDATGNASITTTDIDNGSNDPDGIASSSLSKTSFDCTNVGANMVYLRVTDNSGNIDSCMATVTVVPSNLVTANCKNITISINGSGNATIEPFHIDNGSTACGSFTISATPTTFTGLGVHLSTLTVTDANNNTASCTAQVTVQEPCATLYAYVPNSSSNTVSVINMTTNQVESTIPVGDNPIGVTLLPDRSKVYVANLNDDSVSVIDARTNSVETTIAVGRSPFGIFATPDGKKIYTVNTFGSSASVINTATNMVIKTIPIGNFPDGMTVLPDGTKAYIANETDNTVSVIDVSRDTVMAVVPVGSRPYGIASTPDGQEVYVTNRLGDNISVINTTSNTVVRTIAGLTSLPQGITFSPDGSIAYVACNGANDVKIINVGTQTITGSINVGGAPTMTSISPDGKVLYVINTGTNNVYTINTSTNIVTGIINVGNGPFSLGHFTGYPYAVPAPIDVTPPKAICRNITAQLNPSTNSVTIPSDTINLGSTDDCGIVSFSTSQTTFTAAHLGPNTVTLSVLDESGNQGTCTAIVTIEIPPPPVAICQSAIIQLDVNGQAQITPATINSGSFASAGIDSLSVSPKILDCSNIGNNLVTLTVTDLNGATATCTGIVIIEDKMVPAAMCKDTTLYLNASGNISITATDLNKGSTDNCGFNLELSKTSFDCTNIGANTVTLTVTDDNDNVTTCNATVTVLDTVPPTPVCQDITVQLGTNGTVNITGADIDNGSNDACGLASLTSSKTSFNCNDIGLNNITLTVVDNNGKVDSCHATVTVVDLVKPQIICQNKTIYLDENGKASITVMDIDNGSNDACGIKSSVLSKTDFNCNNVGANTVQLTVTDNHNNVATCDALVTVLDTIKPIANCKNITIQLDATGNATITAADIDNDSKDTCGIQSLALSKSSFDCSNIGANSIILTVTDNHNNTDTCTAIVTIEDKTPPTAICQSTILYLDANGVAILNPADLNANSADICGSVQFTASQTQFDGSHLGNNLITLTVTDESGNTTTCNALVLVEDNIPPQVTCPDNVSHNSLFDSCGLNFSGFNSVPLPYLAEVRQPDDLTLKTNSFGALMAVAYNPDKNLYYSINGGNSNQPLITYDANGTVLSSVDAGFDVRGMWWNPNTNQLEANAWNMGGYRVIDLDVNGYALSTGTNEVPGQNQPDINSFGAYDYDHNELLFHTADTLYRYNRTTGAQIGKLPLKGFPVKFAEYLNGNGSSAAGNINVFALGYTGIAGKELLFYDYALKKVYVANKITGRYVQTIQLPSSAEFNWLWGFTYANGQAFVGGPFDFTAYKLENQIKSPTTILQIRGPSPNDLFPVGDNLMEFEITDQSGNKSFCSYTVTITDPHRPSVRCRDITVSLDSLGVALIDSTMFGNLSTDACGIAKMEIIPNTFTCANIGENVVKLIATDANGNIDSCTAMVTVEDNFKPQVFCPVDTTIYTDVNACTAIFNYQIDTVRPVMTAAYQIDTTITFAPKSTVGKEVTLEDDELSAALPIGFDFKFYNNSYTQFYISSNGFITFSDENDHGCCTGDKLPNTSKPNNLIAFNWGDLNPSYPNSSITYETQGIAPERMLVVNFDSIRYHGSDTNPANIAQVVLYENTNIIEIHATDMPIYDNDNRTMGLENIDGTQADTVAGRNRMNNWSLKNQGIRFAPTINFDNCNGSSIMQTAGLASGGVYPIGTTTNEFTITDATGNTANCTFNVTVVDTTRPTMICQNIELPLDANGQANLTVADVDMGTTDACGIANRTISLTEFDCTDIGMHTVTLTATDLHGNTGICTTMVTIVDTIPPTVQCQDISLDLPPSGTATIAVNDIHILSNDNCDISQISLSKTSFDCTNLGDNIVDLTVTDNNGNSTICSATVTIRGENMPQAGTDILDICGNSVNLDATPPVSGLGSWQVMNTDGNHILSDPFNPKSLFSGSAGVDYVLQWQINNAACSSPPDQVTVGFNPDSDFDTVQDCQDICQGGDDLVNSDGLGMPDGCDCDPNNADDEFIEVNGVFYLENRIDFGLYQCSHTLSSTGKVMENNTVQFKAGYEITLKPGFYVEAGSDFAAIIEYCNNSPSGHLKDTIEQTQKISKPTAQVTLKEPTLGINLSVSPNPFQGQTTIRYSLQNTEKIAIRFYNQIGQLEKIIIPNQTQKSGNYEITLNGKNLSGGLYFVVLATPKETLVEKVLLQN